MGENVERGTITGLCDGCRRERFGAAAMARRQAISATAAVVVVLVNLVVSRRRDRAAVGDGG